MPNILANLNSRLAEGARAYAAFDASDPFSLARITAHLRAATFNPEDSYAAEPVKEMRLSPSGEHYAVTVYKNVRRP